MKMKRKYESQVKTGSALVLVVVLTSLLAIVGVTFIMAARVNRMATSGIADGKDLDSAVDTVIAKISQELTLDTPGVSDPNSDYYDYPGDEDKWLACLEPYEDVNGDYFWRRISDIYGGIDADDLWVKEIIPDYQAPSDVDEDNIKYHYDANGGTIIGSGDTVKWQAPDEAGEYTVTIWVSDWELNSEKRTITLKVTQQESTETGWVPGFELMTLVAGFLVTLLFLKKKKEGIIVEKI